MTAPLTEKGYTTTTSTVGWWQNFDFDDTPELRWPLSVEVYDKMRRQDAQVMSVLRAVTLPIRRTAWRIDPAGATPEVTQLVADDLGLPIHGQEPTRRLRTAGRFSWGDHLRLALLMLPFGHSFFEQQYRIVDGKARLRKLGWRPPRTISKIDVASDGGLQAIHQFGADEPMPVSQLVGYVNDREGGNWLGQSLLRPAYKDWMLKDLALRTQAQTIQRNGLGIPVYEGVELPDTITGEERVTLEKADLAAGLKLASNWTAGNNSAGAVPHSAKLLLRGVEGTLPDADKPIRYYDEQIARAVLAHFLNLGTETGSWALGSTFADFFTLSLQTVAMAIADVTNQHVIEDLVDHNFGPTEPAPLLVFDEIGARHPATAEAILALVNCGAILADDPLEQHLRTTYGLPMADPTTTRARPTVVPAVPTKEAP